MVDEMADQIGKQHEATGEANLPEAYSPNPSDPRRQFGLGICDRLGHEMNIGDARV
jgi:hypothetical protein